jgi:hypothetical protein
MGAIFVAWVRWLANSPHRPAGVIFIAFMAAMVWRDRPLLLLFALLVLVFAIVLFGVALVKMVRHGQDAEEEVVQDIPTWQDGQKSGSRRWQHNIYDENAYAVLGVPQDATRAEIRAAYRNLVQFHHPDAVPPEEKERAALVFVHIDLAYELLTHPQNRLRYDGWIEYLHGQEPPLDEACALFKDPVALAEFDAQMRPYLRKLGRSVSEPGPAISAGDVQSSNEIAPSLPAVADEISPGEAPIELDVPEAVREAQGMQASPLATCARCGLPLQGTRCDRCD